MINILIKNSKTNKISNNALLFEIIMKVITFIGNFAKQNGLSSTGKFSIKYFNF